MAFGPMTAVLHALAADECRMVDDVATRAGLSNRITVKAVGSLISRGFATRAERGCYTLTDEGEAFRAGGNIIKSGPRGPLNGAMRRPRRQTMRDRLWHAIRIKGKASLRELLETASASDDDGDGYSNAQRYLRALHCAGYLRLLPRREAGTALTSNGYQRYQLLRDTGPQAPLWRVRTKMVYDPNTGESIAIGGEQ